MTIRRKHSGMVLLAEVIVGSAIFVTAGGGAYVAISDARLFDTTATAGPGEHLSSLPAQATADSGQKTSSQSGIIHTSGCNANQPALVTAHEGVNLRAERSVAATLVATIPFNTEIQVGCGDGTWYAAVFENQTGYVGSQYVSEHKPSN